MSYCKNYLLRLKKTNINLFLNKLIRKGQKKFTTQKKIAGEWHGLMVSIEDCHSKGRGIESQSFYFIYSFLNCEKKHKTMKVSRKEES